MAQRDEIDNVTVPTARGQHQSMEFKHLPSEMSLLQAACVSGKGKAWGVVGTQPKHSFFFPFYFCNLSEFSN